MSSVANSTDCEHPDASPMVLFIAGMFRKSIEHDYHAHDFQRLANEVTELEQRLCVVKNKDEFRALQVDIIGKVKRSPSR